jgi:glycosyltransferase involved in cell wall biosynthesis
MKIGIAGSMSLKLLDFEYPDEKIPDGYPFPLISLIINALLKRGHSVVAYTCSWHIEKPIVYQDNRLTICIAPRFKKAGRRLFNQEREQLTKLMKQYPADIINAQWTYEFAQAAIDSNIPSVITIRDHASTILKYEANFYTLARFWMNYQVIKKGKHFITNSGYLQDLLSKRVQSHTRVISNFFKEGLEENYIPTQVKENAIVSIANQSPKRKNLINGLKAFTLLRKQYPDLIYYLIGKGTEENNWLHQTAVKKGISGGVRFLGQQPFDKVIELIKSSKILLHPSLEETFGNVVLEAMIVGTPVVGGYKSGNIPHLLEQGKAGKLCNMKNPAEIATTIDSLLNDKDEYKRVREHAYEFAIDNFSQEQIINKLIQYYEDILADKL